MSESKDLFVNTALLVQDWTAVVEGVGKEHVVLNADQKISGVQICTDEILKS